MAQRPVFMPSPLGDAAVRTVAVEFEWHPGLAISQKQKSVESLHAAAIEQLQLRAVLEVSSKSPDPLGVALSAFNLTITIPSIRRRTSVECAFQGSKVFERGGPFTDLLLKGSLDAKRDERLRTCGNLVGFQFDGTSWPIEPQTAFYDWIYISALAERPDLAEQLIAYDGFTDIEFNPAKSINCQAYSIALFRSLTQSNLLDQAMSSQEAFLSVMQTRATNNARQDDTVQGRLF